MQAQEYDIETLNDLIATTIDSVDGYRAAGEDADNSQFQSLFFDRANEREQVADQLQDYVRTLGGTPADDGTLIASGHRAFMGLREAITGSDDTAVIAEVERGEDHIKSKFERALTDQELSGETRALIEQCFESVKSGHDQISALKHGLAN